MNKKVTVIGTVGVPANYGGFETLVENIIGENCSNSVEYTVYCSTKSYTIKPSEYKGAKLKYIALKANGTQSILYDIISIFKAIGKADVLLILGVSGCMILPLIRIVSRKKIIVNIDGLEHKRDKWGKWVRRFLKFSESMAVRHADVIIADNKAIQDYVWTEYGVKSELIAYGGDHVICDTRNEDDKILSKFNLNSTRYSFALCRIEPENNIHLILEAYSKTDKRLVFVGNWNNSNYGKELLEKYGKYDNMTLTSPIYDLLILNVLRSNCEMYIHGHSAGGTNPSLVEAMFFAKPILAFDCSYNRETTENEAYYFADAEELNRMINGSTNEVHECGKMMYNIACRRYKWKTIASQYESLY